MKHFYLKLIAILCGILLVLPAHGKDMRKMMEGVDQRLKEILQKAFEEEKEALKEEKKVKEEIETNRAELMKKILELENKKRLLLKENKELKNRLMDLTKKEKEIKDKSFEMKKELDELVGFIRVNTKELDTLLRQSPQSAFFKDREAPLRPILDQVEFPGMDHIKNMVKLLFEEIFLSGQVRIERGKFVDRSGEEVIGDILVLGNFTAAYRTPKEIGFLLYSDKSNRFFALSKLPPKRIRDKIKKYMDGKSQDVPIDISKGAALRQLTHTISLVEQIPKGGPLIWPILGIGVIGIILVLERVIYLLRKTLNVEKFMEELRGFALKEKWDECINLCKQKSNKIIAKVLLKALENRHLKREDLENVLQESILNEIPKLERFLSTLSILAAIAPLLGLLGTVTGMINTFHVITYYGTGDPRMMSSGISEALITTMLGLSVAIPIMLLHSLISRWVDNFIAKLEENAVALVNLIYIKRT